MARSLRPCPLELSSHRNFFSLKYSKKVLFFLNGPAFTPPPLNGLTICWGTFLRLPLPDVTKHFWEVVRAGAQGEVVKDILLHLLQVGVHQLHPLSFTPAHKLVAGIFKSYYVM